MTVQANTSAATAQFAVSGIKPESVATETQKVAAVVQGNPSLPNHPEIQKALVAWIAAANSVADLAKKLAAARLAVAALIVALYKALPAWKRATTTIVALVNDASGGLPDAITAWGFDIVSHSPLPASNAAPGNLRMIFRKNLPPLIRWAYVAEHVGYVLQIGDGTPAGWGPSINCPKARYDALGLVSGQKVALRVAVIRKSGQSDWSPVLNETVR